MRTVTDQAAHPRHDQQILSFFTSVSPAERPDPDPPDARVFILNPESWPGKFESLALSASNPAQHEEKAADSRVTENRDYK